MKTETIQRDVWKGKQSWSLKHVLKMDGHKLEVWIKCDSYFTFQSFARVKVFDGKRWNALAQIPYPKMVSVQYLKAHCTEHEAKLYLQSDEYELIKLARGLLK